jgi:hypothetical protein
VHRRLLITAVLLACACSSADALAVARERPPTDYWGYTPPASLTESLTSEHFVVHYATTDGDPNAILPSRAQAISDAAEGAYAIEVGNWHFPAPVDDGDGRTDLYVYTDDRTGPRALTHIDWPPPAGTRSSSAWFSIPRTAGAFVVAHELFHVLQYAHFVYWDWTTEPSAVWAHLNVVGDGGGSPWIYADPWDSLDCLSYSDQYACGGDALGYGRWIFFEYLSERYGGPGFVNEIGRRLAVRGETESRPSPADAIEDALRDSGTNVASSFVGYVRSTIAADWTMAGVGSSLPSADTYATTRDVQTRSETVDHLAARYVDLIAWGGDDGCEATTLHLEVTVPPGLDTRPVLRHFVEGSPAVAMDVGSDGVARADLPWRRCKQPSHAIVGLPNGSVSANGQQFTVSYWETADPTPEPVPQPVPAPPAAAEPPPSATEEPGPAPGAPPPAPALELRLSLPSRVTLSRRTRTLTVRLHASERALVRLKLGSRFAPVLDLRPGWNRLRVTLPKRLHAGRQRVEVTSILPAGARVAARTVRIVLR